MVNHHIMQGRLVRDPELKLTQSGVERTTFTVAWSKTYKDKKTECFLDCTAWRGVGKYVSDYFRKGQEILVQGKLVTEKWTDKDGNNRSTNKLSVISAHFCGPKQGGDTSNSYRPATGAVDVYGGSFEDIEDDGDLPF